MALKKDRTSFPIRNRTSGAVNRKVELLKHLYTALRIEHATIPPYLFALFSIRDPQETNLEAARLIKSVAMEEMLHMVLVANIINAIDDKAIGKNKSKYLNMNTNRFGIDYPAPLPDNDSKLIVELLPFSREALDIFLAIEKPHELEKKPTSKGYKSIGQFYAAIKQELEDYCKEYGEHILFSGDFSRQIGPEYYYNGGGEIIKVTNLNTAKRAIKVITDEGEGYLDSIYSGDHEEFNELKDLAHYFKFKQLRVGRYYTEKDSPTGDPSGEKVSLSFASNEIYPVNTKLNMSDFPEIEQKVKDCDTLYWDLIRACEDAFNGQQHRLNDAIIHMHSFREASIYVMRLEVGNTGYNAAPTFKYR